MLPDKSNNEKVLICPSILAADFAALGDAVEKIADSADVIHLDIMDGHYVPNISIGPQVVSDLRRRCDLPFDVHLMVEDPIRWLQPFAESGADSLVIHAEACRHLLRGLQQIRDLGCSPGVVINPGTPLKMLEEAMHFVDIVLLMTVNPGFGGQKYIPTMTEKIKRLRQMINKQDHPIYLEVDGGINSENIGETVKAGADMIVVGSAVFGQPDPAAAIAELRKCAMR